MKSIKMKNKTLNCNHNNIMICNNSPKILLMLMKMISTLKKMVSIQKKVKAGLNSMVK